MRRDHLSIPAEALARQARLRAALRVMEELGPSLEPDCLQVLRSLVAGQSPADLEGWIRSMEAAGLVEEAYELLRTSRRELVAKVFTESLIARLAPLAAQAQQRRSARWQLDARRVLIRFRYRKDGSALAFDDGDLHALFLQALRLEGLRLLLDLGKRPRPLLSIGLPLPAGVGGLSETMDATLVQEPPEDPAALLARLNHRLPEGLHLHQWLALPDYASPVGELALLSRWRWEVPPSLRLRAQERVGLFVEAAQWPWDRGPARAEGLLDLRKVIPELHWEDTSLCFSTRMGAYQAVNPLKMLGAILEVEAPAITDLVRIGVDLKPDPRLGQAERFQPKLKNMYEDAVLLGGGSNITLVEEDDDDLLTLS